MATTEQVQLLGISPEKNAIDLAILVKDATWKDVLVELVRQNQFDPWNIDITQIVDKYVEAIKTPKVMDLRIPANIILAAAVLLRLKSEMLRITEPEPVLDEGQPYVRPNIEVDPLTLRLRPPLKRKIALVELIKALEDAMDLKERRSNLALLAIPQMPMEITKVDIEAEMNKLHELLKMHADKQNMTTFSYLAKTVAFNDVLVDLFVPLLYLATRERIALVQEKFLGEIVIMLN